jgi:hypothetical protein
MPSIWIRVGQSERWDVAVGDRVVFQSDFDGGRR